MQLCSFSERIMSKRKNKSKTKKNTNKNHSAKHPNLLFKYPRSFFFIGALFILTGIYLFITGIHNHAKFGLAILAIFVGMVIAIFANSALPKKTIKLLKD